MELIGKRALVTGASRGIGAAIAVALAKSGADVAFTYQSSPARAEAVVKLIEEQGRKGFAIRADSGDPEAISRSVEAALNHLGGIDILVNNAAVGIAGSVNDVTLSDIQTTLDVNVRGPILFSKAVIPHLAEGGRIITIGSGFVERVPFPGNTIYAMSKSALLSFTRGLARELGPQGITVNLLSPGSTNTEMNPADGPSADFQRGLTPIGRFAEPSEIAGVAVFLASSAASIITGSNVTADGGFNA